METKKIVPWKHQEECQREITRARQAGKKRVLFVMAPGLGKTFTAAFDCLGFLQTYHDSRVLFLAHQNEILDQARRSFERIIGCGRSFGMFNGYASEPEADLVFASFQSLNSELFEKKRGGRRKRKRRLFGRNQFDYIVVDESHHGQAPTYKEVIAYFKPRFLLGMTATPDRMDMQDIRDIFGQEIFSLDIEEALVEGLLTPVNYLIMADEIVERGKLHLPPHLVSIKQLNRVFFARKRDEEIIRTILQKIEGITAPRIMIFSPSIKHAESFAKQMPGSVVVHSHLTVNQQRERIDLFRKGIVSTAITIDQFNEGVDIPEANVLVFLRSTQSRTVFFQQLGRGLRRLQGKDSVLVLDFVASCERLQFLDYFRGKLEARTHERGGPHRTFSVKMSNVRFEERAQDVIQLLQKVKRGLSDDVLLDYLRKLAAEIDRTPTTKDLKGANGYPDLKTYIRHFGSWNKAVRLAGFRPIRRRKKRRGRTDGYFLRRLQKLATKLGRVPSQRDMSKAKGYPNSATYKKHFGSWNKALEAAKLIGRPPTKLNIEETELLDKLAGLARKLGREPSVEDIDRAKDCPSCATYRRHFGSRKEALKRAGII